jgi:hypothetical protein
LETPAGDCRKYVIVDVSEDIEPAPPGEGEMAILFIAEPDAISRGQCAELYWQVETPEPYEITLDEQLVEPVMGREVCPEETTTYHLIVHRPDGSIETARTVEVLDEIAGSTPTSGPGPGPTNTPAAPDTTPPAISSYTVNPLDFIYTYKTPGGAYCTETPTAFYFSATVTDAGGVASVVLDWTGSGVRNGPATLNPIGGNQYVHSLGLFLNPGLLSGFSITATDNASNTTTVYPTWSLDVEQCNY